MTTKFNPIQHGQEIVPPEASKRARKRAAGGEKQALIPFACIMGSARRKEAQEEGKMYPASPGKVGAKGRSDAEHATRRKGGGTIAVEGIPGKGTGKARNPDQPFLVNGAGRMEGPHRGTFRGRAAEELGLFANASRDGKQDTVPAGGPHRGTLRGRAAEELRHFVTPASQGSETVNASHFLMPSSGGTGMQSAGSSPGAIALLLPKGVHGQTGVDKGGLTGARQGQLKPEGQKTGFQAGALKAGTGVMAAAEDTIHSKERGARGADPAGEQITDTKKVATVFRHGGITGGEAGEKFRVAETPPEPLKNGLQKTIPAKGRVALFQNEENGAGKNPRAGGDTPEPLDSALKNAAVMKEKIVGEKGGAERSSGTPPSGSGRDTVGNQPGLEAETAAGGHEKTGAKIFRDHTAGILHREPSRSGSVPERDLPVGGYQHTALHAGGKTAAVSGNAGISPRVLIDQVANGAKMPGRVRIALNPPSLGTLDVDVLVRDNKVHVILQTENSDVKQMLQSHMESLKGSLRSQGLIADSIQVFAQEKSNGDTYGYARSETLFGEGGNQGRHDRDRGSGGIVSNHVSPLPAEEPQSVRSDGHISVFA